jgi:hypothetical protein
MESVTTNYLVGKQQVCRSWSNYINASDMTAEDAINYVRKSLTAPEIMAHILFAGEDGLTGFSTAPKADGDYTASYNDLDIFRLSAQLTVINRDRISSIGELEGRISKLSVEYKAMQEQLSRKLLEQEQVQALIHQSEYYFANADRKDLSAAANNRLEICKSSMQANDIESPDDIIAWRERNNKLLSEIESLKNTLSEKKNKLVRYTDICDTYKRISRGDYISNLIEDEKLRREQEKNIGTQKTKKKKGSR